MTQATYKCAVETGGTIRESDYTLVLADTGFEARKIYARAQNVDVTDVISVRVWEEVEVTNPTIFDAMRTQ